MQEYSPQILSKPQLLEKAKLLPHLPGVYMFFDKNGKIIYVGKSKSLHNRVLSYLQNIGKHPPKTEKLVQTAVDFQTIVTQSESEALILENEKIKLHQPKFNIRLKDDKSYPYIKLSLDEDYPRLSLARRLHPSKKDKAKYFGPYSSSQTVYSIINTANKIFSLPTCSRRFPAEIGKARPCLYLHLNRCCGVCDGRISKEEYAEKIEHVIAFLKNDYTATQKELTSQMEQAAENMEFERAAKLRDSIRALSGLSQNQQIIKDLSFHADVFGVFSDECGGCINMLSVRGGRIIDSTNFHFGADEILDSESFSAVLAELYRSRASFPKQVLLPASVSSEDSESLHEYISSRAESTVFVYSPERGIGRKLVSMAADNARESALHRRAMMEKDEEVLIELASLLGLEVLPERIESIDISNSGSDFITASIITVKNARFSKRDYKSFNIRLEEQNDVGSMYEAIFRRVKRSLDGDEHFSPLPDLILADGAQGQVHAVKAALSDLGVSIPVFGMVKDEFHKTRCLTDGESEISIARSQRLFRFIYNIQEEVHRFALSRMDSRRRKSVKQTSLTRIPGIGEKKAGILLRHFKSQRALQAATKEEIAGVKGISARDAENITSFFQTKKSNPEGVKK